VPGDKAYLTNILLDRDVVKIWTVPEFIPEAKCEQLMRHTWGGGSGIGRGGRMQAARVSFGVGTSSSSIISSSSSTGGSGGGGEEETRRHEQSRSQVRPAACGPGESQSREVSELYSE
jgi:hypothetical protein